MRSNVNPATVLEYVGWSLALLAATLMIVSMPWTGAEKVIPGEVWLAYSLVGILVFGGLATAIHLVRTNWTKIDDTADTQLKHR